MARPRWLMKSWKAARRWSKRAGILVFAVCSLEREEGEEQIAAFPGGASGICPRAAVTPMKCSAIANGSRRKAICKTLPCHLSDQGGMDGFYAARLRRNA